MKQNLLEKAQRKLSLNTEDYTYDEDLLGDYFDDAVAIVQDWKRNYNEDYVLTGQFDTVIIQYIIESINWSGLEGQTSSSANGVTKTFIASPEANLKSRIPQSL